MLLSWWSNLVARANSKAKRPLPRCFRSALTVEQLEDRLTPVTSGSGNLFLNTGTVASPSNTITAVPGATVPVYIDFDTINTGPAVVTASQAGTVTFSYNGTSGGAFTFATGPSGTTAASFQTYVKAISGLAGATVTGNNGGPFTITFASGTQSYLFTSTNGTGKATIATNQGIGAGTFYILYDPTVLSTSETPSSVGADIKLSSLVSSLSANYFVVTASGPAPGVISIGLNHVGTSFVKGAPSGHLLEIDFHVAPTAPMNAATLLDLQGSYQDPTGALHQTNFHDTGAISYTLSPALKQYASVFSPNDLLTQPGVTTPATFSPSDSDTTDASIQIISGTNPLAPTTVPDVFSMAPNTSDFYTTMAVTAATASVLTNDTPTSNGPMYARLVGAGVTSTVLPPVRTTILGATETGMVATITVSDVSNLSPGEAVTIAGVPTSGYNGTFEIATVDPVAETFTYVDSVNNGPPVQNLPPDPGGLTAAMSTSSTTIYSAATPHGQIWLNASDGSFAYSPNAGFTGTDTFTYQAIDAASGTPSATTATIYVGGDVYIPQTGLGSQTTGIGSQVVVPVNILDPNAVNSGGLGDVTIGINYDPTVFDPNNIEVDEGTVGSNGGWTQFTANTSTPGQIIITTSNSGGPPPIFSSAGGSLALITFNVIGLPTSAAGTSVINLSAVSPQTTEINVLPANNAVVLPMAFAPTDNLNFNGSPGPDDGLVQLAGLTATTTTVGASVGAAPVTAVGYGSPVTLTATVAPASGNTAPALGSVDFKDGTTDLGTVATDAVVGNTDVFQLVTTPRQLQVLSASGGQHTITATYAAGTGFGASTGTLVGGLTVNPLPLAITATPFTKTYDSTTAASATPTVAGLLSGDSVTGLAEAFANANAGSSKTLTVTDYTISDGNSGKNYAVTTVVNTAGVITKAALTITAQANTKTYDSTISAAATPIVAGLIGSDSVTGLAEVYSDANAGSSKTLSVSGYAVSDPNNYTVTTVANTSGTITTAALTITAQANTKTYDSTISAAATPIVAGLIGSDSVTGLAEVYSDANAGSSKTLSVSGYAVSDPNNYTVTTVANTSGTITTAALTITAQANTKTYDSTISAAATPIVAGLIGSDSVTGFAEVYSDANAGSSKTLSVSGYAVSDPNNYTVTTVANTSGTITTAALTITAQANTKTYDSTISATATPIVAGLIGSDSVTGFAEVYSDANAGSSKTLSVSGYAVSDPNNYTVTTVANTSGTITTAALTITAQANTKTYDSTISAAATPIVAGLIGSDTVTGLAEIYSDANAGTSKTLLVSAYTISDPNNYTVTTVANTAGVITGAPLTVTINNSLMLVGNNPPPLTGSVNGTPFTSSTNCHTSFGDFLTITLSTTATAASPVGQYVITANLSGANAGNYIIDPATSQAGTMYVVSVGADPSAGGALSVAFWDNKGNKALVTAAELASLDALNLANQEGAAFDPNAVAQLQAWLSISPNATTSYQLAVQLAVLDLNVLGGYVQSTDLVYAGSLIAYQTTYGITGLTSGGFISVQNLMSVANAVLGNVSPGAPAHDPNQAYELALAQVLSAVNANSDFVSQEAIWNLFSIYGSLVS